MRKLPERRAYVYAAFVDRIVDNSALAETTGDGRPEDVLRAAIVAGRLLPNERLVEADMTRRLGVGRSAVRTALARLEHEGLVQLEPHRGARVRLVSLPEAVEILETRAVLEGLAVRQAAATATPVDVDDLRAILRDMRHLLDDGDLLQASDRNAILHKRLLQVGGHATANRLIAALRSQLVRFQYRTILLPGRSERSLAEHTEIVEAVAAGDPEAAEAAMRTHLWHVADALRRQERNQ
jgi:DNA-binding GntR family transcriptional regulator